jgi:hypothetical protein
MAYKKVGTQVIKGKNRNIYMEVGSKSKTKYIKQNKEYIKIRNKKPKKVRGGSNLCFLYSRRYDSFLGIKTIQNMWNSDWQPIEFRTINDLFVKNVKDNVVVINNQLVDMYLNTGVIWEVSVDKNNDYYFKNKANGSYLGYKYINDLLTARSTYTKVKTSIHRIQELGTELQLKSHIHFGTYDRFLKEVILNKNPNFINNTTIRNIRFIENLFDYDIVVSYIESPLMLKQPIIEYLSNRESGKSASMAKRRKYNI